MPFYNREREIKQMKALLSGEPNLVYFVYGPINSGKTALLMKVFKELPEDYVVFYINFRGRYIQNVEDLIKVLFRIKERREELKEFLKKLIKGSIKLADEVTGIPISQNIFNTLFQEVKKIEDVFAFLEDYFGALSKEKKLIFVLDEIQSIKEVINKAGRPVISELFNFMVRLTKETHLCHSLCATSDCLFIEDVYSNARLEGRAKYILVDDLEKEEAFKVYENFGFKEKELIWNYIGGKLGDMISLFEEKKRGLEEKEALEEMVKDVMGRLSDFLEKVEYGKKFFEYEGEKIRIEKDKIIEVFQIFCEKEAVRKGEIMPIYRNYLVSENILFYNPVEGTVKPQGKLIQKAMKRIILEEFN